MKIMSLIYIKKLLLSYLKQRDIMEQYVFYQYLYDKKHFHALYSLYRKINSSSVESFVNYEHRKIFCVDDIVDFLCKYDVISFDIFDTLLFRLTANPTDVFHMIEDTLDIPGYARFRIQAELNARYKKEKYFGHSEVCLDEIYSELYYKYGERCKVIQSIEIQKEFECCFRNPTMIKILKKLQSYGKNLIAISDMYLSHQILKLLLYHCGVKNLEEIFVSCDFAAGKSTGELFRVVMQKYADKTIVHIGDNFTGDILGARSAGIDSLHYLTALKHNSL